MTDGRVRLRIDLAYDGTPFAGFARQPDQTTVQGTLEGALSRVLGHDAVTTVAGRTDRGVHARAQVCHVDVDTSVPRAARAVAHLPGLRKRLDAMTGDPITVWGVAVVSDDFDARFSATARFYRYRLVDTPLADPITRHDRWHVGEPLAVRPMQRAAKHLLGEHDFAALCRRSDGKHTIRRLDHVTVSRDDEGVIHVRLDGPAFCHQQVRSIVGCLVEVGAGRRPPDWVGEVLASRDRARAARVAPPQGLVLERVSYGRRWPAAPQVMLREVDTVRRGSG